MQLINDPLDLQKSKTIVYFTKITAANWSINNIVPVSMALALPFFQELQRRLDQTLGKPGNYHHGIDKTNRNLTIGGRLYRLENQVCIVLGLIT